MKKKLFISIVLVMLLFASAMTVAGKPSDLPDQADRNGRRDDIQESLYNLFDEIAFRIYQKKGRVPLGILEVLNSLGSGR